MTHPSVGHPFLFLLNCFRAHVAYPSEVVDGYFVILSLYNTFAQTSVGGECEGGFTYQLRFYMSGNALGSFRLST